MLLCICFIWLSVLNISSVCLRVTWIRWLRNMLCRHDFHQVFDFNHHFISIISTIIVDCRFRMNLITCKKNFASVWKNLETIFWEWTEWWIFIKSSTFDSWFLSRPRSLRSENRFRIFSYRWKILLACHQVHTKMRFNDNRKYYKEWCDDRDKSERKNNDVSFRKAMSSYFKKRWVLISKSDEFSFQKAMRSFLKKRWDLISKSDEYTFEKAMRFYFNSHLEIIYDSYKWLYKWLYMLWNVYLSYMWSKKILEQNSVSMSCYARS
jgi:hypothetical protein